MSERDDLKAALQKIAGHNPETCGGICPSDCVDTMREIARSALRESHPEPLDSLKCPKCDEGYAGRDCTGEAMDCHYCDGTGRITAVMFCEQSERLWALIGDAMVDDAIRREGSGPVDEGWLREIGGVREKHTTRNGHAVYRFTIPKDGRSSQRFVHYQCDGMVWIGSTEKGDEGFGITRRFTTRRQLLDLLRCLGCPVNETKGA